MTYGSCQLAGEGEGRHDVAVGVDHTGRDGPRVRVPLHDARDAVPIPHPVQSSHKDAAAKYQKSCHSVVKLGYHTFSFRLPCLGVEE